MSEFWQILEQLLSLEFSILNDFSPLAIFFIIFLATFITEDGACFAAGALASQGKISFAVALAACFSGILIGDIGIYWIGRIFGEPLSNTRLFKYFVSDESLVKASKWLNEKGALAIVISRFVSGLRLPTYLVAGFLKISFPKFAFYFFAATIIWTPILVGSSAFAFELIPPQYILFGIITLVVIFRIVLTLSNRRTRRRFIRRLKRISGRVFSKSKTIK